MAWSVLGTALFATLAEYWGHRLMHQGYLLRKHPARHHPHGRGQGSHCPSGCWRGSSSPRGGGVWVGGPGYAALAAYAHEVQHEPLPKLGEEDAGPIDSHWLRAAPPLPKRPAGRKAS